jgi:transcriptional regulator with XRE-family HTH domain
MDSSTKSPQSQPPPSGWATNTTFARTVGVHFTTASRYRNGERVPSTGVAQRIAAAYSLDPGDLLQAIVDGREAFGHFMRMNVFGPEPKVDLNEDGTERLAA